MEHVTRVLIVIAILTGLLGPALASAADATGFGGINRDPSNGIGAYVDRQRALTGRHHTNEMNPVYVPGHVYAPAPPVAVYPGPAPVWVPGFWVWDGFAWAWVPGYWTW
jgi:hypothetical protein